MTANCVEMIARSVERFLSQPTFFLLFHGVINNRIERYHVCLRQQKYQFQRFTFFYSTYFMGKISGQRIANNLHDIVKLITYPPCLKW